MKELRNDSATYRAMSEPLPMAEASANIDRFFMGVESLRKECRIRDVALLVQVATTNEEGREGTVGSSLHLGDELQMEPMIAWALGKAQAERQARIGQLLKGDAVQQRRGA